MKKIIPITLIVCMTFFSLLAITIGIKLAIENPETSIEAYKTLHAKANQGDHLDGVIEKDRIPSNILFTIYYTLSSSAKYAYGDGSYLEAYDAHSHRKGMEKKSLYLHIILGGIILITGCFQFWIWFRRRYKKLHRFFGITYVISSIGLGFFVLAYLLMAGMATTHEEYIGYLGLHFLNFTTVIPVFISIYYLYKKDFGKHLGWMALSFGSILTAPTQRISWGILAYIDIGQTHAVANSIVDTYLFASCYIIGYLLFCVNRVVAPLQSYKPVKVKPYIKKILYGFSFLASSTVVLHYCFTNGMVDSALAKLVIGGDIIIQEKNSVYFYKSIAVLYGIINSIGLMFGAYVVSLGTSGKNKYCVYFIICSSVIALIELYWGYTMGVPKALHAVGGSYYMFWGIVHLFFTFLVVYAVKSKNSKINSFLDEWIVYLWILLFAAATRYWYLYIHVLLADSIPTVYIQNNHVHQFIVALPMAILAIIALITSVYGSNTTKRSIY